MNVNGIKEDSHALIEHHLSKFDISCCQETKFPDLPHQRTFEHTVLSKFPARIFINDRSSEEPQMQFPRSWCTYQHNEMWSCLDPNGVVARLEVLGTWSSCSSDLVNTGSTDRKSVTTIPMVRTKCTLELGFSNTCPTKYQS